MNAEHVAWPVLSIWLLALSVASPNHVVGMVLALTSLAISVWRLVMHFKKGPPT